MMVMTAKVDFKKLILIIAAAAAVILALILIFGGDSQQTSATAVPSPASNDGRVQFLRDLGWEVTNTPTESSQVRIPQEMSDVYRRYNALQQSQGYDLSTYAGKNVLRYVYQINNYPGATQPVYATLLVYKGKIIGGDITNTAAGGKIHALRSTDASTPPSSTATEPTATTGAAGAAA